MKKKEKLTHLPNIGVTLERQLNMVGIHTLQQLQQIGSQEAFARIHSQIDPNARLHKLYAIEGAAQNIPYTALTIEEKLNLKEFWEDINDHSAWEDKGES